MKPYVSFSLSFYARVVFGIGFLCYFYYAERILHYIPSRYNKSARRTGYQLAPCCMTFSAFFLAYAVLLRIMTLMQSLIHFVLGPVMPDRLTSVSHTLISLFYNCVGREAFYMPDSFNRGLKNLDDAFADNNRVTPGYCYFCLQFGHYVSDHLTSIFSTVHTYQSRRNANFISSSETIRKNTIKSAKQGPETVLDDHDAYHLSVNRDLAVDYVVPCSNVNATLYNSAASDFYEGKSAKHRVNYIKSTHYGFKLTLILLIACFPLAFAIEEDVSYKGTISSDMLVRHDGFSKYVYEIEESVDCTKLRTFNTQSKQLYHNNEVEAAEALDVMGFNYTINDTALLFPDAMYSILHGRDAKDPRKTILISKVTNLFTAIVMDYPLDCSGGEYVYIPAKNNKRLQLNYVAEVEQNVISFKMPSKAFINVKPPHIGKPKCRFPKTIQYCIYINCCIRGYVKRYTPSQSKQLYARSPVIVIDKPVSSIPVSKPNAGLSPSFETDKSGFSSSFRSNGGQMLKTNPSFKTEQSVKPYLGENEEFLRTAPPTVLKRTAKTHSFPAPVTRTPQPQSMRPMPSDGSLFDKLFGYLYGILNAQMNTYEAYKKQVEEDLEEFTEAVPEEEVSYIKFLEYLNPFNYFATEEVVEETISKIQSYKEYIANHVVIDDGYADYIRDGTERFVKLSGEYARTLPDRVRYMYDSLFVNYNNTVNYVRNQVPPMSPSLSILSEYFHSIRGSKLVSGTIRTINYVSEQMNYHCSTLSHKDTRVLIPSCKDGRNVTLITASVVYAYSYQEFVEVKAGTREFFQYLEKSIGFTYTDDNGYSMTVIYGRNVYYQPGTWTIFHDVGSDEPVYWAFSSDGNFELATTSPYVTGFYFIDSVFNCNQTQIMFIVFSFAATLYFSSGIRRRHVMLPCVRLFVVVVYLLSTRYSQKMSVLNFILVRLDADVFQSAHTFCRIFCFLTLILDVIEIKFLLYRQDILQLAAICLELASYCAFVDGYILVIMFGFVLLKMLMYYSSAGLPNQRWISLREAQAYFESVTDSIQNRYSEALRNQRNGESTMMDKFVVDCYSHMCVGDAVWENPHYKNIIVPEATVKPETESGTIVPEAYTLNKETPIFGCNLGYEQYQYTVVYDHMRILHTYAIGGVLRIPEHILGKSYVFDQSKLKVYDEAGKPLTGNFDGGFVGNLIVIKVPKSLKVGFHESPHTYSGPVYMFNGPDVLVGTYDRGCHDIPTSGGDCGFPIFTRTRPGKFLGVHEASTSQTPFHPYWKGYPDTAVNYATTHNGESCSSILGYDNVITPTNRVDRCMPVLQLKTLLQAMQDKFGRNRTYTKTYLEVFGISENDFDPELGFNTDKMTTYVEDFPSKLPKPEGSTIVPQKYEDSAKALEAAKARKDPLSKPHAKGSYEIPTVSSKHSYLSFSATALLMLIPMVVAYLVAAEKMCAFNGHVVLTLVMIPLDVYFVGFYRCLFKILALNSLSTIFGGFGLFGLRVNDIQTLPHVCIPTMCIGYLCRIPSYEGVAPSICAATFDFVTPEFITVGLLYMRVVYMILYVLSIKAKLAVVVDNAGTVWVDRLFTPIVGEGDTFMPFIDLGRGILRPSYVDSIVKGDAGYSKDTVKSIKRVVQETRKTAKKLIVPELKINPSSIVKMDRQGRVLLKSKKVAKDTTALQSEKIWNEMKSIRAAKKHLSVDAESAKEFDERLVALGKTLGNGFRFCDKCTFLLPKLGNNFTVTIDGKYVIKCQECFGNYTSVISAESFSNLRDSFVRFLTCRSAADSTATYSECIDFLQQMEPNDPESYSYLMRFIASKPDVFDEVLTLLRILDGKVITNEALLKILRNNITSAGKVNEEEFAKAVKDSLAIMSEAGHYDIASNSMETLLKVFIEAVQSGAKIEDMNEVAKGILNIIGQDTSFCAYFEKDYVLSVVDTVLASCAELKGAARANNQEVFAGLRKQLNRSFNIYAQEAEQHRIALEKQIAKMGQQEMRRVDIMARDARKRENATRAVLRLLRALNEEKVNAQLKTALGGFADRFVITSESALPSALEACVLPESLLDLVPTPCGFRLTCKENHVHGSLHCYKSLSKAFDEHTTACPTCCINMLEGRHPICSRKVRYNVYDPFRTWIKTLFTCAECNMCTSCVDGSPADKCVRNHKPVKTTDVAQAKTEVKPELYDTGIATVTKFTWSGSRDKYTLIRERNNEKLAVAYIASANSPVDDLYYKCEVTVSWCYNTYILKSIRRISELNEILNEIMNKLVSLKNTEIVQEVAIPTGLDMIAFATAYDVIKTFEVAGDSLETQMAKLISVPFSKLLPNLPPKCVEKLKIDEKVLKGLKKFFSTTFSDGSGF